jgi:hypothetical protein
MTYYYYIVRGKKIERFITPMYGSWFEELTTEQREFYLANPNATVQEVINCQLTPPYVPPTPDVQEYAAQKVKELHDACYASISVTDLEYAMANACLAGTSIAYSGDKYYTTIQAIAVMKTFMDESTHAITIYDTYKPQIEAASTIEDIDNIYNTAIGQL